MAVYLVLGHAQDTCCARVACALEAAGHTVHVTPNPFSDTATFSWSIQGNASRSQLAFGNEPPIAGHEIAGVLVRSVGWVHPGGWDPRDHAYMQAETQAALLGWLWSLHCPVVNRCSGAVWYRAQGTSLTWSRMLRSSGLSPQDTLVTNVDREARTLRGELEAHGFAGAVYGPLTSGARYLVAEDGEWAGIESVQRRVPVALSPPQLTAMTACLVGTDVIWSEDPDAEAAALKPKLLRFASKVGLQFMEFILAFTAAGPRVQSVDPHPRLENYTFPRQERIIQSVVRLLTGPHDSRGSDYEVDDKGLRQ